jgi:hypothetical protein
VLAAIFLRNPQQAAVAGPQAVKALDDERARAGEFR